MANQRAQSQLLPHAPSAVTDLLERPLADAAPPRVDGDRISLRLRPFELVTLRLRRGSGQSVRDGE